MTKTRLRSDVVVLAVVTALGLALCGGCTPIGTPDLGTFVRDLLLNALAALLL